jgi:N-acetylglucosaminyldiphosphoundecaprenol N-acetyl-beta-D-mannosaminyltransferase
MNIKYIDEIPVSLSNNREIFDLTNDWLAHRGRSRHIITLNALMLLAASRYNLFKAIIQQADLVTVDGYGIDWILHKKGCPNTQRLTGVDLTRHLLTQSCQNAYSVYFFGGTPQITAALKKVLPVKWPGLTIAGVQDGYGNILHPVEVFQEIRVKQPHLLLVGLGVPEQELFLAKILPCLDATVGIGVGGTFEVLCGFKRESPQFIRNHGWEWCFRMLQEPRKFKNFPDLVRFWYRYLR